MGVRAGLRFARAELEQFPSCAASHEDQPFSAGLKRTVGAAVPIELTKVEFPMIRADSVDRGISEFEREPIIRRFTIGADLRPGLASEARD